MTAYSDVPQVNLLYEEKERVLRAVSMLEAHGTMTSFIVVPPEETTAPPMVSVTISTQGTPLTTRFLRDLHSWCLARSNDIDTELAALGVTETPATPPSVDPA